MIQLFRPKFRTNEIFELVGECFERGWTGQGFLSNEFEEKFSEYLQLENILFLNSASSAIHLALETLKHSRKWNAEAEVISTPLTFVSTNHAIEWAKLNTVLVDIDQNLCMDPEKLVQGITVNTKAVIFVAMGGNIGQFTRIQEICREHNLALIVDAAHATGSKSNGVHLGTGADAVCYSFQAVKNLPTADSGALHLKDRKDYELARKLSWLGISTSTFDRTSKNSYQWRYEVNEIGFKYNGNAVMGAMALVGLRYLDRDNEARRKIAETYSSELENCKGIQVIPHVNKFETSRHLFQIYVTQRDKLATIFSEAEVGFGVHYISNTEYPAYNKFKASTPKATEFSNGILSLPLHLFLKETEIEFVLECIHRYSSSK